MKRVPLLHVMMQHYPDYSKDQLFAMIMCGEVYADGERSTNPRALVPPDVCIEIQRKRFVSRGGEKLDAALERLSIDVRGLVFLDAGASTGGFTDCLLRRGAKAVHAVDVGYNQLDYSLRNDRRVYVHERTNLMSISSLDPVPDAAVADLSFRSLRKAASKLLSLTSGGWGLVLFKPQFEGAGKLGSDFTGLVDDDHQRYQLLGQLTEDLKEEFVRVESAVESPIAGKKKGNREIILKIRRISGE